MNARRLLMKKQTKKQRRQRFLATQLRFGKRHGLDEEVRKVTMTGIVFDSMMERAFDEGWKAKAMSDSE